MAASRGDEVADKSWRKIALPEITILTTLPDDQAAIRAREFAQYLAALRTFFAPRPVKLTPATMLIFAQKRDFVDRRPLDKSGRPEWVGGFFLRHESWAVIALPGTAADDVRHRLFHEGAHWFMDGAGYANALWLNEGMAEAFSTFRVEGGRACWGELLPQHVELLSKQTLEPLERVVFTSRDLFARDEKLTSLFYAESWAFVHMLLFGETDLPHDGLVNYNQALAAGVNADAAFAMAFGLTYDEMDAQLARYVANTRHHFSRQPLSPPAPIHVEPATAMEVDEALGRLALVGRHQRAAIAYGQAMIERNATDPRGHALLGVACKEAGDVSTAEKEFELAAKYGCRDFQPYFELGNAIQTPVVERGADLSASDARRAIDLYEMAVDRYTEFEGSYANIAGLIGLVDSVRDRDVETLRAGAHLFPDNSMISLGLAQWYYRSGDHESARALTKEVEEKTTAQSVAGQFARQLEKLWDNQEFVARVSALVAAKRFDDALRAVDEHPVVGMDLTATIQVLTLRRDVNAARKVNSLNDAIASQDWDDARNIVTAILASDASPAVKANAKRILREIDRR